MMKVCSRLYLLFDKSHGPEKARITKEGFGRVNVKVKHGGELIVCSCSVSKRHKSSSSQKVEPKTDIQYCIDLVRRYDRENYLATTLMPKDVQRAALVLRAFTVELAQIPDAVSEKQIGIMRMQFWKDSMGQIYQGTPPQMPVAVELAGACGYYNLSKHWLERIVEARASHMTKGSFLSMKEVEEYAEKSNSSLYYLLLECLGIKNVHADHVGSHLGKAHGLVTLVRSVPYHGSKRSVNLPLEVLSKHKVSQEDVLRGRQSQNMKDVVYDIASEAHIHLEQARNLKGNLPDKSFTIFLNAATCDYYLKALQRADFNVFDGKLQQRNHLLGWNMYWNRFRKRF